MSKFSKMTTATNYPFPRDLLNAEQIRYLLSSGVFVYGKSWNDVWAEAAPAFTYTRFDDRNTHRAELGDSGVPAIFKPLSQMFGIETGGKSLIRQQFRVDARWAAGELVAEPTSFQAGKLSLGVRLTAKRTAAQIAVDSRLLMQQLINTKHVRRLCREHFKCDEISADVGATSPRCPLTNTTLSLSINDANGKISGWGDDETWRLIMESPQLSYLNSCNDGSERGSEAMARTKTLDTSPGAYNVWAQTRLMLISKHLRIVIVDTLGDGGIFTYYGADALRTIEALYRETARMPEFGTSVHLNLYPISFTFEDVCFSKKQTNASNVSVFTPVHCDQLLIVRGAKPEPPAMRPAADAAGKKAFFVADKDDWRATSNPRSGAVSMNLDG